MEEPADIAGEGSSEQVDPEAGPPSESDLDIVESHEDSEGCYQEDNCARTPKTPNRFANVFVQGDQDEGTSGHERREPPSINRSCNLSDLSEDILAGAWYGLSLLSKVHCAHACLPMCKSDVPAPPLSITFRTPGSQTQLIRHRHQASP